MPKKSAFLFAFLIIAASFVSYKLGVTPVAMAGTGRQENAAALPPPTLPAAPATWALSTAGGNESGFVSVTRPAVAGAQHVVTCITATYVNDGSSAGTGAALQLIDGSVGGGTLLLHWGMEATDGNS